MEKVGSRKVELHNMRADDKGRPRLKFLIPACGLLGYRGQFIPGTRGTGIMHHNLDSYRPCRGEIVTFRNGVVMAILASTAAVYALDPHSGVEPVARESGDMVYEGMVVVDVWRSKCPTNIRCSTSEGLSGSRHPRKWPWRRLRSSTPTES